MLALFLILALTLVATLAYQGAISKTKAVVAGTVFSILLLGQMAPELPPPQPQPEKPEPAASLTTIMEAKLEAEMEKYIVDPCMLAAISNGNVMEAFPPGAITEDDAVSMMKVMQSGNLKIARSQFKELNLDQLSFDERLVLYEDLKNLCIGGVRAMQ